MKFIRTFLFWQVLGTAAIAGNLSHYDLMRVDFGAMRNEGIIGVIHEATYPSSVRDDKYFARQVQATRAGLLWGAYHYANASDPTDGWIIGSNEGEPELVKNVVMTQILSGCLCGRAVDQCRQKISLSRAFDKCD